MEPKQKRCLLWLADPVLRKERLGKGTRTRASTVNHFSRATWTMAWVFGTQTEQSENRKAKDYSGHNKYGERPPFKHSDEDSEIVSDDISDIFRFLDDMSVCGSLGVVQSIVLQQQWLTVSGDEIRRDSSPDRNTVKLGKTGIKLDRLFQSLENSDDELKESVCKLVLRIGEIEKKLESLQGCEGRSLRSSRSLLDWMRNSRTGG